jgi:hypothetical protein
MARQRPDSLLEFTMGSIMTQVALCRFLIRENVIQKDRLISYFDERGQSWGKTANAEALLALVTIKTALTSDEEPSFPTVH